MAQFREIIKLYVYWAPVLHGALPQFIQSGWLKTTNTYFSQFEE